MIPILYRPVKSYHSIVPSCELNLVHRQVVALVICTECEKLRRLGA